MRRRWPVLGGIGVGKRGVHRWRLRSLRPRDIPASHTHDPPAGPLSGHRILVLSGQDKQASATRTRMTEVGGAAARAAAIELGRFRSAHEDDAALDQ